MGNPDATARHLGRDAMGLVRVADLVDAGTSHGTIRRRVARGEWERPHANVLDVSLQRWSWRRRVLGAVMTSPRGTLASHGTAAALHGLPGYEARGRIELLAPRSGRNRDLPFVLHSTTVPAHGCTVDDVPCTDVVRTLHSLAAAGHHRGTSRAVRASLRRGLATPDDMLTPRLAGLPGRSLLARAVAAEAGRTAHRIDSAFEEQWLDVLLLWDLPPFTTQHPVTFGGRRYRLDVAWAPSHVALEADGDGFHGDLRSQDADGHRQERLRRAGWTVHRVGRRDLAAGPSDRVRRWLLAHLGG